MVKPLILKWLINSLRTEQIYSSVTFSNFMREAISWIVGRYTRYPLSGFLRHYLVPPSNSRGSTTDSATTAPLKST
jgi:hypothetical protein